MVYIILVGCSDSGTGTGNDAPTSEGAAAIPPPVIVGDDPAGQAAELLRKGDPLTAVNLLRAALATQPDDRNLRLAAAEACVAAAALPIADATNEQLVRGSPQIEAAAAARVQAYFDAVDHVTFLINARLVDAELALRISDSLSTRHLARSFPKAFDPSTRSAVFWAAPSRAAIEQAKESFLLTTFPQVLALGVTSGPVAPDFHSRFQQSLILAATHRIDAGYRSSAHVEHVRQVLTTALPDHLTLGSDAPTFLIQAPRASAAANEEPMTRAQWMEFLAKLDQPAHAVARIYGKYAVLWLESEALPSENLKIVSAWVAAADALLNDIESLPYVPVQPTTFRGEDPLHRQLLNQRNAVARRIVPAVAQRPVPKRPIAAATPDPNPTGRPRRVVATPAGVGTIRFERIEPIKVQMSATAYIAPDSRFKGDRSILGTFRYPIYGGYGFPWHHHACGDFDVLWNSGAILSIRQRGLARELFVDNRPRIQSIAWDGRYIWAASHTKGICAMDPEGRIVAEFDQTTGLPQYSQQSIELQALSPGRVLAIANKPESDHAWIAALNASPAAPNPVTMIHEANQSLAKAEWRPESHQNTKWPFHIGWTHRVEGTQGNPPVILVGRRTLATHEATYPLAINPQTLAVTTFRHAMFSPNNTRSAVLHSNDGRLFMKLNHTMWVLHAFEDKPPVKVSIKGPNTRNEFPQEWILPHGDWIYFHGRGAWWWRLHTSTLAMEELFIADEAQRDIASWSDVSSFYGVMLLDHDRGIYYRPLVEPAVGSR